MIKKILITIALILTGFGVYDLYLNRASVVYAKSYGNITVNFHSTLPGNTIFDINNFLPSQSVTKTIDVKNDDNEKIEVFVNGDKKTGSNNPKPEKVMDIEIKQGNSTVYSKKLNKFLDDDKVSLGKFNKHESKSFNIKVTFNKDAGNEYQGKFISFNLYFSDNDKNDDRHDRRDEDRDDHDNRSRFQKFFERFKR